MCVKRHIGPPYLLVSGWTSCQIDNDLSNAGHSVHCNNARSSSRVFVSGPCALCCSPRYFPRPKEAARSRGQPMESEEIRELRATLLRLKQEHRDLDSAINALEESGRADALQLKRLKKKKLYLKDEIARIEDQLLPDIIA